MVKALFFDIDGTLVSFKTHRIPHSTISAIEQAKARGVRIYISTGRPLSIINNIGEIADLEARRGDIHAARGRTGLLLHGGRGT